MVTIMKIYLKSIGCRLNQSEIENMAWQLLANGHELVDEAAIADKVIINTCAVTREAAKDARKMTRRIHRENAEAEILLTGCYATVAPEEAAKLTGAGRIVKNQDKDLLVAMIDPKAQINLPIYDREPIMREFLDSNKGNTRAFVKVQDGCDNRCTFCVTTIARGSGRSRRVGDVVKEIQALSAAGYKEVVLTGVHLGSFGRDIDKSTTLGDLVAATLRHTDIDRLRLSSLEPWDIPDDFFERWRNPRLLPHLHIPLQSGSDPILRRMARRTTRDSFRELVAQARATVQDLSISTDLIVGFPGETESEFQETLDFVSEIGFSRLHVFPYSRRPGTAAAEMSGQVPPQVKKERSRRLIDLGRQLSLSYHRRYDNQNASVLWESMTGNNSPERQWLGYTTNYIRVKVKESADLFNQITSTRLSGPRPEGMTGTIISASTP
jgi:threonylcarbamoyladenosine tRNA methylthiotransferase MtaB